MPVSSQEAVIASLCRLHYQVVPADYRTYCVLNSLIAQRVLRHFGIAANVTLCQVWYAGPLENHTLGVPDDTPSAQWPGHTVCVTDSFLLDAALHHFRKRHQINVPDLLAVRTFGVPSNVIARYDLSPEERLWWHHAPADTPLEIPHEPDELVDRFALALISRMSLELGPKHASDFTPGMMQTRLY